MWIVMEEYKIQFYSEIYLYSFVQVTSLFLKKYIEIDLTS